MCFSSIHITPVCTAEGRQGQRGLEFWKVCPKNIRSEEEEAGAGGGGVGDKDVAAGDLLAKEHFLSQLFKAGGDCI